MLKRYSAKPKSRKRSIKKLPTILIFLLAIIVVLAILEVAGVIHLRHKNGSAGVPGYVRTGISNNSSGSSAASSSTPTSSPGSNSQPAGNSTKTTAPAGGASDNTNLLAPYGQFINFHNATLDTKEVSVCSTSPGATCTILFKYNGKTISLGAKTTDGSGSAYWGDWTPGQLGLTKGSWTIEAVASLGSQSKQTTDNKQLIIK